MQDLYLFLQNQVEEADGQEKKENSLKYQQFLKIAVNINVNPDKCFLIDFFLYMLPDF